MASIESFVKPGRLYRYRSLERFERELAAIEEGYLFCSAYEALNDPMEGRFTSGRLFRKSSDHLAVKEAIIDNKARVGMCSFSEVNNNELMWAHYADHFCGICIAYSVRLLLQHLGDQVNFVRMFYDEKAPIITRTGAGPENLAKMILSHKSYRWQYEREWRMFAGLGKTCYRNVDCVTRVYLGYRISRGNRARITRILKRLQIEKKEMTIKKYFIRFE
jgi:hypothetical protein